MLLLYEVHEPQTGSAPSVAVGAYFGNLRFQLSNLNGGHSGRLQGYLPINGMDCSGHCLIDGVD
jgi:hypothetical protein